VVAAMRPNLRVSSLVASDPSPQEKKTVRLTATVTNDGDIAAPATQTQFLLDGTTVLGNVSTPALGAGESASVWVDWNTRHQQGDHVVRATADGANTVIESDESDNAREVSIHVRGNQVRNGSFESGASSPDNWSGSSTSAGTSSWSNGGTDGLKSASATGNGGNAAIYGSPTWTSDAIAVAPGQTLQLATDVRSAGLSSAPTAGLVYLDSIGQVLGTVRLLTAPLQTQGFITLEQAVTVPPGVAQVRVVLTGFASTDVATAGTVTFDDVGLFTQ
jgi:hypothetical protein